MRENNLRRIWRDGGAVVNGWLSIPCGFSAEVMAHAGWDSLTVDMQHGLIDYQAATAMLTAISTAPPTPLVRAPWLEPGIVMKALDAGAYGVICPMINSRADAERFARYVRYPPAGERSFGPIRAALYGGEGYADRANEEVLALAMIETRAALENLDDIASVPGLDALYVGPSDLGASLGFPPRFDPEEPEILRAIDAVLDAARDRGLVAGIHTGSVAYASRMIEKGFRFVTVLSDARFIAAGARATVSQMRAQMRAAAPSSPRPR